MAACHCYRQPGGQFSSFWYRCRWYCPKFGCRQNLDGGAIVCGNLKCSGVLVKRIHQKGVDVILCTPTVIEERHSGKNPLDKQLDQYAAIVRKVARKNQCRLCDMRKAFVDYLKVHNPENKLKDILTTDYVHLNTKGNTLVMENMIKFS